MQALIKVGAACFIWGFLLVAGFASSLAYEKAREAAQHGDYITAERCYREALETEPHSVELWNGLGVALNRQNRFTDAADAFRTALKLAPSISGIRLNLGIALFRGGKLAEAAETLQPINDQPQARELLAMAYVGLEQYVRALPILEPLAQSSKDPAIHVALAACYAGLKRNADVERAVAHMFETVPDSAALHIALAEAYRSIDAERALAEYRKAEQMEPKRPEVHLQTGRLLWQARRFDEAEPEFRAELALNPGAIEAKYYLGTIYLYKDDAARAAPLLEEFVRVRTNQENGYMELGRALMKLGRFDASVTALEKAAALAPGDPNVHYQLALAYRGDQQPDAAQREFNISRRIRSEQLDRANQTLQEARPKN